MKTIPIQAFLIRAFAIRVRALVAFELQLVAVQFHLGGVQFHLVVVEISTVHERILIFRILIEYATEFYYHQTLVTVKVIHFCVTWVTEQATRFCAT